MSVVQLKYLHEHIDDVVVPENVWWDEELQVFCIHDDADNFRDTFHLQFQIGGWAKKNGTWLAQVGYGHPNERVILERRNKQQLHIILQQLIHENDESQFWSFKRVRSINFYKPAPAEEELSVSAGEDDSDAAAAAASRS